MIYSCESDSAETCSALNSNEKTAKMIDMSNGVDIKFYPLPVDNVLNIEFGSEFQGEIAVFLFDTIGEKIKYDLVRGGSNYVLDMKDLPQGLYVVRVSNKKINVIKSIMKKSGCM